VTARELAENILRRIEEGSLDPEAVVVRPLCVEEAFVEVRYVDQVVRRLGAYQGDPERRVFDPGAAPIGETTVKLG